MFKNRTETIGSELAQVLRGLVLAVEEVIFRKKNKIKPDWDRAAQIKWAKDISSGTACKTCGCFSCDRTGKAKYQCIASEGGAAK